MRSQRIYSARSGKRTRKILTSLIPGAETFVIQLTVRIIDARIDV